MAKCTGKDFTVRNASGAEDGEILSMLRKTEDGHILFLTNHDRNNAHQVYIKLDCGDAVEELDPLTGEVRGGGNCCGWRGRLLYQDIRDGDEPNLFL